MSYLWYSTSDGCSAVRLGPIPVETRADVGQLKGSAEKRYLGLYPAGLELVPDPHEQAVSCPVRHESVDK